MSFDNGPFTRNSSHVHLKPLAPSYLYHVSILHILVFYDFYELICDKMFTRALRKRGFGMKFSWFDGNKPKG